MVVGSPASGKTTLTRHEALRLQKKGFDIVPVCEASEIRNYYYANHNQVFVCDDCFGSIQFQSDSMNNWSKYITPIQNILNTQEEVGHIILMTSRLDVYKSVPSYDTFGKSLQMKMCDLTSRGLVLTKEEKQCFLSMYLPHISDSKHLDLSHPYFPLLCKLARIRDLKLHEFSELLRRPMDVIKDNIEVLRDTESIQFCCLCLLAFFDDRFSKTWLVDHNVIPEDKLTPLKCIIREFNLKLKYERDRNAILKAFESLEMSYISHSNGIWSMIHKSIYEQCLSVCGKYMFDTFLEHADPVFVSRRYLLECIPVQENKYSAFKNHFTAVILVSKEKESVYFGRLKKDILKGDPRSTVHNIQFAFKTLLTKS